MPARVRPLFYELAAQVAENLGASECPDLTDRDMKNIAEITV
jgi:hypothetical protein